MILRVNDLGESEDRWGSEEESVKTYGMVRSGIFVGFEVHR